MDAHGGRAMQRLTVMANSRDRTHHHSLATEVLARARHAHLAGATVVAGMEGLGHSGVLHRRHVFGEDVPLAIVIVDEGSKIQAFVEASRDALGDALVIVEDVTAFRA